MVNKVFLQGRLTADPEIRTTQSGAKVANFSIAVERPFKDKSGSRKTDFLKCEAWRGAAETTGKYFKKGDMILVVGAMYQDSYTDNNGNRREKIWCNVDEIHFCESKRPSSGADNSGNAYAGSAKPVTGQYGGAGAAYPAPKSYGGDGAPYSPSVGYGGDGAPAPAPANQFADLADDESELPF